MTKKKMTEQVIKLMKTITPSKNEEEVRNYLRPILETKFGKENVFVDSYGNLFGEWTIGTGEGATVTLSAHMDSVNNYAKGRKIVMENGIIRATDGICGADDKAGIAIILEVLRNVPESFSGRIKVAFFVEEEIGCVGSSQAMGNESKEFMQDSNLAIVVDRRDNRDIVVGNFSQVFCSTKVGEFFEEASAMQGMDWKCVEGGISDTASFADLNVNGVNLSAGYRNEHSKNEWVSVHDMYDTVKLICQALAIVNHHYGSFGDVPEENKWITAYSYSSYTYGRGSKYDWDSYYDTAKSNANKSYWQDELAYQQSTYGTVEISDIGGVLSITQGYGKNQQEILLTAEDLEGLIMQYYDSQYGSTSFSDAQAVKGGKVDLDKEPTITEDKLPF